MNNIRQEAIRRFIEENNVVSIKEIHALFPDVSLMTIHRDLDALEQGGAVIKVRGGARSVHHAGDIGFDVRLQENRPGKMAIAQKAMSLIEPNSTIFLDAGTTNLMIARLLPDINLHIFTTGPNIAIELCRLQNANITLCSGKMNRKNIAVAGQNAIDMLEHINIDLAFIGVSGCSVEAGFTCGTEEDMLVKRTVIRRARASAALCDKMKFSRLMPYTFADFSDWKYLVSDGEVPLAISAAAGENGVKIL